MGLLRWLAKKRRTKDKCSRRFDRKNIILNVEKDPEDSRDYTLAKISLPEKLPVRCSLKQYCTSIKNQGSLGACTGFALTGAFEIFRKKYWNEELDMSELFSYYQGRVAQGWENRDTGAYIRDVCKSGLKDGHAFELFWPYNISRFREKPPRMAYWCARFFRLEAYYRCWTLDEVKQALAEELPVLFGFKVYTNFFNYRRGMYKSYQGSYRGGHAVVAVGYDDEKKALLVRNSWGTWWGEQGYFWMDYTTYEKLLLDAWAIKFRTPTWASKLVSKALI